MTKKYFTATFWRGVFLPCLFVNFYTLSAQQSGDKGFQIVVENPAYAPEKGPIILIDEAHNNFHTREGRYAPFASVLSKDGYNVKSNNDELSTSVLSQAGILVIANALHEGNLETWTLPTPSAFSNAEIEQLNEWVKDGGSLFLIADHMPFPGASEALAKSFGFIFYNGFCIRDKRGNDIFSFENNGLIESKLTNGRNDSERISSVQSFTGQCFEAPASAQPILVFDEKYNNKMPQVAWEFDHDTEVTSADGLLQGAYMSYGKGRIVVFGEAAMFTAQTSGNRRFGMSAPKAKQNAQLLLNIIHWLDGLIE